MSEVNSLKDVQVGDVLWHLGIGRMRVTGIDPTLFVFQIILEGIDTPYKTLCSFSGATRVTDCTPMVYWNKPEIIAPPPPKRLPKLEVDDKVIVVNTHGRYPRHFSHFNSEGSMRVFANGRTSHTVDGLGTDLVYHYEVVADA